MTLPAIFTVMALTAVWNLYLLRVAFGDWRAVQVGKHNGPIQVLAFARVRHKAVRLSLHLAFLILLVPRVFWHRPATPLTAVVLFALMVVALVVDVASDAYDAHLLKWFLSAEKRK